MDLEKLESRLRQVLPRAALRATPLPTAPALQLYLFDPASMAGPLSHEEAQAVVAEPAYWSFCWASGQVLAAYLLEHPEWVRGKRVLDFGCGSGVVAIAAAMAGAREVIACDIDANARAACQANARLNGVMVVPSDSWQDQDADLILAADVLYDRDNLPLLQAFCDAAPQVLLADSRIRNLAQPGYRLLDVRESRTLPDLQEFEEFNRVRIYLGEPESK